MSVNEPDPEPVKVPSTKEINLLEGFPATSRFIARDPAKTTVIFRRFDELAVRNLLHLEAQLVALEGLQQKCDQDDAKFHRDNEPIRTVVRSWEDFAVMGTAYRGEAGQDADLPLSALRRWGEQRLKELGKEKKAATEANMTIISDRLEPMSNSASVAQTVSSSHGPAVSALSKGKASSEKADLTSAAPGLAVSATTEEEISDKKVSIPNNQGELLGPITIPPLSEVQPLEGNLNLRAFRESRMFYDNELGCGPASLELIQARWDLSQAMAVTLKEYQEAVFRYREILKLEVPAERTKTALSEWIAGERPGTKSRGRVRAALLKAVYRGLRWVCLLPLRLFEKKAEQQGPEVTIQFLPGSSMHTIYAGESTQDLVGVGRIAGVDLLTRWVSTWKPLYLFKDKHFGYPGMDYVPEAVIHVTATLLTVVFAVIMVIGGIWGLYYLRAEQSHFWGVLLLLSLLIVLFAILMKLMTTASRTELFGATAGYAAVLVLFVAFQAPNDQSFRFVFSGTTGNGTI